MSDYHTRKYDKTTSLKLTRRQVVRLMKIAKRLGVSQSEAIRHLIDTTYVKKGL